jgi:hypothetical protein
LHDIWALDASIPFKNIQLVEMISAIVMWVFWLERNKIYFKGESKINSNNGSSCYKFSFFLVQNSQWIFISQFTITNVTGCAKSLYADWKSGDRDGLGGDGTGSRFNVWRREWSGLFDGLMTFLFMINMIVLGVVMNIALYLCFVGIIRSTENFWNVAYWSWLFLY